MMMDDDYRPLLALIHAATRVLGCATREAPNQARAELSSGHVWSHALQVFTLVHGPRTRTLLSSNRTHQPSVFPPEFVTTNFSAIVMDGNADSGWNTNPVFAGSPVGDGAARPQSASEPFRGFFPRQNPAFHFPLESTVVGLDGQQGQQGERGQRGQRMNQVVMPVASLMGSPGARAEAEGSGRSPPRTAKRMQGQTPLYQTGMDLHANQTRIKSSLGADHPEESRFEEILRRLFTHEVSLSEGVKAFRDIAVLRGKQLRELAIASGDSSSPIHAKLMKDAEELHYEGKTWSLLYYLFAHARDEDGHDMSYPAGTGGKFVSGAGMQKTLHQHAVDMVFQDKSLNRAARVVAWLEEEQGRDDADPAQGIGRKDGVWKETRMCLDGAHEGEKLVRRLDPDGMIREDGGLARDNAKDEERLAKVLWRLMRSGRLHQAAQLCHYVGQPWRAASLTGYGRYGPLPVGNTAEEADENETGPFQTNEETLAGEVEGAEFGTEGETKVLWRWACHNAACAIADRAEGAGHGRFESAMYGVLSGDVDRAMVACSSWEDSMWAVMRCWLEYQIDTELLAGGTADEADEMDAGDRECRMEDVDNEIMKDPGQPAFPIPAVAEQMPADLPSAVLKGAGGFGGIESIDPTKRFRKVQIDLILGNLDSLVDALKRWIVPGGSTEEAQDCPPGLMRFSAHLALLLWRMDLVKILDEEGSLLMDRTNDGLQKLLWIYIIHLIDSASYELVPTYVVHLRKGLRRTTMQLLLEEATYNERIEVRKSVSSRCDVWLDNYIGVEGINPGEMWASAQTFCAKSMRSSFGGPLTRADSISWMFFDEKNRRDATRALQTLCHDLTLSGVRGALAGLHLLREVIPPSIGDVQEASCPAFDAWETYFEVVREAAVWQAVFSSAAARAEAHPDDPACNEALAELSPDTLVLLEGIVNFYQEGLAWIEDQDAGADGNEETAQAVDRPLEAVLVLGPSASADAPSIDDASVYPEYPDAALLEVVAALKHVCSSAVASSSPPIEFTVGSAAELAPPDCDLPGLACVKVTAAAGVDRASFETAAVGLFCSILKNEPLDLIATNIISSPTVSSAVCKAIVSATLVMHIARIREALAFIGESGETPATTKADALIDAVKGEGVGGGDGVWTEDDMKLLSELRESTKSFLGA